IRIVFDENYADTVESTLAGGSRGRRGNRRRSGLGCFRRRANWKPHGERCPVSDTRTSGVDSSSVVLDEASHDREAEAEPTLPPRGRGFCLGEAIKDTGKKRRVDPLPGIGDLNFG